MRVRRKTIEEMRLSDGTVLRAVKTTELRLDTVALGLFAQLLVLVLVGLFSPPSAQAAFGLKDLGVSFEEQGGAAATEAGTHPFQMTTELALSAEVVPKGAIDPVTEKPVNGEVPEGQLKDLTVAQMPGFVGSQTAVEPCTQAEFTTRFEGYASCPDESAVGFAAVKAEFKVFPVGEEVFLHLPIYMLEATPGVAARFGFVAANVPITFDVAINQSPPYNLIARLRNTSQALLVYGSQITLWGNPSDPAHDSLRGQCIGPPVEPTPEPISKCSAAVAPGEALLTLPRSCRGPLATTFAATSWQGDSDQGTATTAAIENCGTLAFSPEAAAAPTTAQATSASGLDFGVSVEDPGLTDPGGRAEADIAAVEVILPEGMTANPSAAEGQGVCTAAQLAAVSPQSPGCPAESKLGSAEIVSPLLDEPLQGILYLAEPYQNPFASLLATYLVIRNEKFGIAITQAGRITPDPLTGRLTTSFTEIPELPFSDLRVSFRSGPRAPLVTPPRCATYSTRTLFTPSSGNPPLPFDSSFAISQGPGAGPCPTADPFSPGFLAGSLSNQAGAYAPFYLRLTRSDADQQITRVDAVLPPGVVGRIAGLGRCTDAALAAAKTRAGKAELAAPSCPAGSRIGSLVARAGVGEVLTTATGSLHLAGPYAGAPLSIAAVVPAVAGPFDLGTVVVRQALDLDPDTAEVVVRGSPTDPIPTILAGIPLRLRDLQIYVDRPNFTLNPTSCEVLGARATLFGSEGATATPTQRYQATGCGALGFKPKLKIALKGGTKRAAHPALHSVLVPRKGDANIGKAVVTLPPTTFIDPTRISNPCTRVQFDANACPKSSILGKARAITPLLDKPLEGPVYFRSNGGERKLPDIVADLKGQFRIVLVGFIDSKNGGLRTRFLNVPDAPVTKFTLDLKGGKKGLLQNSANLCTKTRRVRLALTGQNGRRYDTSPPVGTSCKGKPGKG